MLTSTVQTSAPPARSLSRSLCGPRVGRLFQIFAFGPAPDGGRCRLWRGRIMNGEPHGVGGMCHGRALVLRAGGISFRASHRTPFRPSVRLSCLFICLSSLPVLSVGMSFMFFLPCLLSTVCLAILCGLFSVSSAFRLPSLPACLYACIHAVMLVFPLWQVSLVFLTGVSDAS